MTFWAACAACAWAWLALDASAWTPSTILVTLVAIVTLPVGGGGHLSAREHTGEESARTFARDHDQAGTGRGTRRRTGRRTERLAKGLGNKQQECRRGENANTGDVLHCCVLCCVFSGRRAEVE